MGYQNWQLNGESPSSFIGERNGTMDGFHLSELEIQKVVFVCYVAVVCHKLRFNVVGNSCDILCKCGSKVEGHLNVL